MKNLMQAPVAQKYDKLLYLINAYSDEERDNIGKKYEAFVSQIINNKRSIFSFKTFNEMNVLC